LRYTASDTMRSFQAAERRPTGTYPPGISSKETQVSRSHSGMLAA
jgi:hypothetical protein